MIISTKTFDEIDLDKLDEEFNALGFAQDYSFCDDGLLELTVVSLEREKKFLKLFGEIDEFLGEFL